MITLTFVNLIQAGIVTVGLLGAILLWHTKPYEFRGLSLFMALASFGSVINLLEETGLTRDIYLISPVLVMVFGPATYLAARFLIAKGLPMRSLLHLAPTLPVLFMVSSPSLVIAIGTMWRFIYALLTVLMLVRFKRQLDHSRSDSDDYSLGWLVWLLVITAGFNLIDLIRLNLQHSIPYELNILGQGLNNIVWLVALIVIVLKLQSQQTPPNVAHISPATDSHAAEAEDYQQVFDDIDKMVTKNKWYLQPRLTLADLGELTGLQTRDISRAINLGAKHSFNEYINRYRVAHVQHALDHHLEQSLLDIAFEAGFSSKATFNKVFKQITGASPSSYITQK